MSKIIDAITTTIADYCVWLWHCLKTLPWADASLWKVLVLSVAAVLIVRSICNAIVSHARIAMVIVCVLAGTGAINNFFNGLFGDKGGPARIAEAKADEAKAKADEAKAKADEAKAKADEAKAKTQSNESPTPAAQVPVPQLQVPPVPIGTPSAAALAAAPVSSPPQSASPIPQPAAAVAR